MQTPGTVDHGTPGFSPSGSARGSARTLGGAKSSLKPRDDTAEIQANERQRSAMRLKRSLAGAFEGGAGGLGVGAGATGLSKQQLEEMMEMCLKLAAENKITAGNAWGLRLIDMLPDIIRGEDRSGAFSFQRVTGGLDAGVQIYSKRVDHTYKQAFATLQGRQCDDDEEEGGDSQALEEGGDPAAGARKKRRGGGNTQESDTLADAESLKMKEALDASGEVDPLFHRTCALFDEGGAKGMLLNNLNVFGGCSIMFDSSAVPEQQFDQAVAAEPDIAVNMRPLRQALQRAQAMGAAAISPSIGQLYQLLCPVGQQGGAGNGAAASDVAAIMAEALRDLPQRPRAAFTVRSAPHAATSMPAAASSSPGASMQCSAGEGAEYGDEEGSALEQQGQGSEAPWDAHPGSPSAAEEPVFGPEIMEAVGELAAGGFDDDDGGGDWFAGDGGDDSDGGEGAPSFGAGARPQAGAQPPRAGSGEGYNADVLGLHEADSLQALMGSMMGAAGARGWGVGGGFWRSRSTMQAAAAKRKGGAVAKRGRNAAADEIDWQALLATPLDADAFAEGTAKQICKAAGSKGKARRQMLPDGEPVQPTSLHQLFFKPHAVLRVAPSSAATVTDAALGGSALGGGGAFDGGAGFGDEYDDDDDDAGGDYYGDGISPEDYEGGQHSGGSPSRDAHSDGGWGSDDEGAGQPGGRHDLLQAPRRLVGSHATYSRASKQVDVAALKHTIWHSLLQVNTEAAAQAELGGMSLGQEEDKEEQGCRGGAAGSAPPTVPFQSVIQSVPRESAAGRVQDLSVHMCFICLLHLANENGLVIKGAPDLTTLNISQVPGDAA